ncbi:MAG: hypothetical protein QNK36_17030 [Colwellia sp.]|nr:hypothetical protein [Colwellia sp.]
MLRSGVSKIVRSDEKVDWSVSEFGFDGAVNYITDITPFNT